MLSYYSALGFSVSLLNALSVISQSIQPAIINPGDLQWASDILADNDSASTANVETLLTPNNTLTSNIIVGDSGPIGCFERKPGQPFYYSRIPQADYLGALENILRPDSSLEMQVWSMKPSENRVWRSGKCKIGLANPEPSTISGTFQAIALGHMAARIMQQCSSPDANYGGVIRFGFRREFMAMMGGTRSRDPRLVEEV